VTGRRGRLGVLLLSVLLLGVLLLSVLPLPAGYRKD